MSTSPDTTTPAAAEAEAETARAGLVSTLNQLRENLKPANMVDEVMSSAKVNASAITDQVMETARRNPLPALMIGAGLAMIFGVGTRYGLSGSQSRAASGPLPTPTQDHRSEPEFRAHIARTPTRRPAPGFMDATRDAASNVGQKANDLLDAANDRLGDMASRGKAVANNAYASAKRSNVMSRTNVGSSLSHLVEEQPLILAAVGIAIGAAIGAALPHTQTEDRMMGETSGSLRDAAQSMVQDQVTQVKAAATHAVEDIKQTVADHGVTSDNLTGLVRDIGDKAKSATYEAGRAVNPQS